MPAEIRLFLCGDVMTGRGIDQALPHPGNPALHEGYVRDARDYVRLAERANGPIPRPVKPAYLWGDALAELRRAGTDLRIINLETSITASDDAWPGKGIHYRMHPRNIDCLTAARIDCCCLANNHLLDWGYAGLAETLGTLDAARIPHAGAGKSAAAAAAPVALEAPGRGRVLVESLGSPTSGIPDEWAASQNRPGVNLLKELSREAVHSVAGRMRAGKRPGDVTVTSIHWGGNWGYDVPDEEVRFAHTLVDGGADLVHGHSSHHPKALEVYRGKLILYGCGDFLDDDEGISGYEAYRDDLPLIYLVRVDARAGQLQEVCLVPFQARRFRLHHASAADARWLCDLLNRLGARSTPASSGRPKARPRRSAGHACSSAGAKRSAPQAAGVPGARGQRNPGRPA